MAVIDDLAFAITAKTTQFDSAMKSVKGELGSLEKSTNGLRDSFMGLLPAISGALIAGEFIKANSGIESTRLALAAVSGSTKTVAGDIDYLIKTSNNLGVSFSASTQSFVNLSAAAKGTRLEGAGTRDIFEAISGTMSILGKTSDQTTGALYAVGQMMNKGKVYSEELVGQLSERLPGAFGVAAKAMNTNTVGLIEMLKNGKVITDDFLPKFATGLKEKFGVGTTAISTFTAEMNRLKNEWQFLLIKIGDSGAWSLVTSAVVAVKDNLGLLMTASALWASFMVGKYTAALVTATAQMYLKITAIYASMTATVAASAANITYVRGIAMTTTASGLLVPALVGVATATTATGVAARFASAGFALLGGPIGIIATIAAGLGLYVLSSNAAAKATKEFGTEIKTVSDQAKAADIGAQIMRMDAALKAIGNSSPVASKKIRIEIDKLQKSLVDLGDQSPAYVAHALKRAAADAASAVTSAEAFKKASDAKKDSDDAMFKSAQNLADGIERMERDKEKFIENSVDESRRQMILMADAYIKMQRTTSIASDDYVADVNVMLDSWREFGWTHDQLTTAIGARTEELTGKTEKALGAKEGVQKSIIDMGNVWSDFKVSFSSAIVDIITEGGSFKDKMSAIFTEIGNTILKTLVAALVEVAAKWAVVQGLDALGLGGATAGIAGQLAEWAKPAATAAGAAASTAGAATAGASGLGFATAAPVGTGTVLAPAGAGATGAMAAAAPVAAAVIATIVVAKVGYELVKKMFGGKSDRQKAMHERWDANPGLSALEVSASGVRSAGENLENAKENYSGTDEDGREHPELLEARQRYADAVSEAKKAFSGAPQSVKDYWASMGGEAFAKGGIVTGPMLGLIGEAGQSEAVIPLDRMDEFFNPKASGGGSQTIIINLDGKQIARQVVERMPSVLRLQGIAV